MFFTTPNGTQDFFHLTSDTTGWDVVTQRGCLARLDTDYLFIVYQSTRANLSWKLLQRFPNLRVGDTLEFRSSLRPQPSHSSNTGNQVYDQRDPRNIPPGPALVRVTFFTPRREIGEANLNPFTTASDIACAQEIRRHWMPKDLSLYYGFGRRQLDLPIREQAPDIQDGHVLYFGSLKNRVPARSSDSSSNDLEDSGEEPEPEEPKSPSPRNGPRGSAHPGSASVSQGQATIGQGGNSGGRVATEGERTSAFRRLTPLHATVPSSPSWGSVDSSGRRFHGNISPANSSTNLSNRETSSGEYTIRSASLATPEPEQELGSISRDEEPDTKAEERGELALIEQSLNELLTSRGLQHLILVLETIGIGKTADLSYIYLEDLLE